MACKWLNSDAYDIVKALVVKAVNQGWSPLNSLTTAFAEKTFKTIAAPNTAVLYLEQYDELNWELKGTYETEGHNILTTTRVVFSKNADEATIDAAVNKFLTKAESEIKSCRMVRLAS